jgi:hypothetical protein
MFFQPVCTCAQDSDPLHLFCTGTLKAWINQRISRILKLATGLKSSPDKEAFINFLWNLITAEQKTLLQPLEFLQALNQLSAEFDGTMKKNWKSRRQWKKIAKEIAKLTDDFSGYCQMDKEFVSTVHRQFLT